MSSKLNVGIGIAMLSLGLGSIASASAETFEGIEFPGGASSFADRVVKYEPNHGGGPAPTGRWLDSSQATGAPNFEGCCDTSLGRGGRITLQFIDNVLTGSGDEMPDLHIFEVGPDVEDTYVEISRDGKNFVSVGKVHGSISSVDIDAHGFGPSDRFYYVRLTDDPEEGDSSGRSVGADIDAVGAIATRVVADACAVNPVISQDLSLHIPNAVYQNSATGEMNMWVDFKYLPNPEGRLLFEVTRYGVHEE